RPAPSSGAARPGHDASDGVAVFGSRAGVSPSFQLRVDRRARPSGVLATQASKHHLFGQIVELECDRDTASPARHARIIPSRPRTASSRATCYLRPPVKLTRRSLLAGAAAAVATPRLARARGLLVGPTIDDVVQRALAAAAKA